MENYPGFPNGITGSDLIALFKRQLQDTGIQVTRETAVEINYKEDHFVTQTNQRKIISDYAVIATGTIPKTIPDLHIVEDINHRLHYEVYPLLGEKDKTIAIIGAGKACREHHWLQLWRDHAALFFYVTARKQKSLYKTATVIISIYFHRI